MKDDYNKKLKEESGNVVDDTKLVLFLYSLLRDHLPAGVVEELVRDSQGIPVEYTNGYLANYANNLADRLK